MLGSLPEEFTPFVGRRRELSQVRTLLGSARMLTLIGPGGVGKTRLALAIAADRQRAFPDGVWFGALDGIEDDQLLMTTVADALGLRLDINQGGFAESLALALRDKHLLLVLDNCEHVIDTAALLAEHLIRMCPNLRILTTSRMPIRVAGEVTYLVPPMWMPADSTAGLESDLDESDAVQFFVERARRVLPGFELTTENRASVYELVRRLDRLPLAMELGAVRLRSLTPQQIAERLSTHETMLSMGSRSAPLRQRTMRSSIRWSAEMCRKKERQLWARLSVFRGTFDLDAVEAVCGDGYMPSEILDVLQALVERSIIAREDHGSVVRYSMLELIRHFGEELVEEVGEDIADLNARHRSWFLSLASRADADWNTDRQTYWLRTLPFDHKNIVRALTIAADETDSVDAAAEAVVLLWRYYWWAPGWIAEGVYWVERCARLLANPVLRARLLILGSLLATTCGDGTTAAVWHREGVAAAEETRDQFSLALAEHVLGNAALYRGQAPAAAEHFRRASSMYDTGSTSHRVDALLMLTLACGVQRDIEGAEAAHLESLFALAQGEKFQRSYSLLYVGEALRRHGSLEYALTSVRNALCVKAEIDDPFGLAWTFETLAEIASDAGEPKHAALLLGIAGRMWKSMAIEISLLDRFRMHEGITRDRLRVAIGTAAFERLYRRGQELELTAATAVALDVGAMRGERQGTETVQHAPAAKIDPEVLSTRESEVAHLVTLGLTNRQIAAKLVISQRTADTHVQNILVKLGFNTRTQIAAWVSKRPT